MNLLSNPVFLTQRRLVHRSGVLAAVLIALLIGLCSLAAYLYQRATEDVSLATLGRVIYASLLALQAVIVVIGGFSRISRTLVDERRVGLLDSNRLTPLRPSELVLGYWLGAGLREAYMAAVLAPIGVVVVLLSGLPLTLWLETQALLLTTALLFGLLAVLAGMALSQANGGVGMLLLMLFLSPVSLAGGAQSLISFLLPIHTTQQLFGRPDMETPHLFGLPVPSLALTWALQLFLGTLCWRGAVRKLADPTRPAFTRRTAVLLFGVLVFAQHGLVWKQDVREILAVVHGATLVLGLAMVVALSLKPDQVRVTALRLGDSSWAWTCRHSGVSVALALAAVAGAALATHFAADASRDWRVWLAATVNLATALLSLALMVEICRLLFRRGAGAFIALGAFVFCVLPLLLALMFQSEEVARFSFFAPGVMALSKVKTELPSAFVAPLVTHVGIVAGLAVIWWWWWRKWLLAKNSGRRMSGNIQQSDEHQ